MNANSIPTFASELLRDLAAAFDRRGKPIRHRSKSFSISRDVDSAEVTTDERLQIDAELPAPNTKLRLVVWATGDLWLWAGKSTKLGWAFEFECRGVVSDIVPSRVVELLEQSMGAVPLHAGEQGWEDRLRSIWKEVELRSARAV